MCRCNKEVFDQLLAPSLFFLLPQRRPSWDKAAAGANSCRLTRTAPSLPHNYSGVIVALHQRLLTTVSLLRRRPVGSLKGSSYIHRRSTPGGKYYRLHPSFTFRSWCRLWIVVTLISRLETFWIWVLKLSKLLYFFLLCLYFYFILTFCFQFQTSFSFETGFIA